ncbi:hypothetical protein BC831DRAFT_458625 [Entophlyctis helioformis]|nr:hypothetical protein BC831DRAFT_458625 [Entophlyctis helioformis]
MPSLTQRPLRPLLPATMRQSAAVSELGAAVLLAALPSSLASTASASASASTAKSAVRKAAVKTPRKHACPQCPSSFQRVEHLSRHSLTHSGTKPFNCSTCHKGFARADAMRRHVKVHDSLDAGDLMSESSSESMSSSSSMSPQPLPQLLPSPPLSESFMQSSQLVWTTADPTSHGGLQQEATPPASPIPFDGLLTLALCATSPA